MEIIPRINRPASNSRNHAGLLRRMVVLYPQAGCAEKTRRCACAGLYTLLLNKYYVDEVYAILFIRPFLWISTNVLWHMEWMSASSTLAR